MADHHPAWVPCRGSRVASPVAWACRLPLGILRTCAILSPMLRGSPHLRGAPRSTPPPARGCACPRAPVLWHIGLPHIGPYRTSAFVTLPIGLQSLEAYLCK